MPVTSSPPQKPYFRLDMVHGPHGIYYRVVHVRPNRHKEHPAQFDAPWFAPADYWTPPPPKKPKAYRGPRLANDPDKHIRFIKGKFEARPYDLGERYNLGRFATKEQARKAIAAFWRTSRGDLPRFVRRIRAKCGDWFLAMVPVEGKNIRVGDSHPTAEAAAAAVKAFVERTFGPKAEQVLRRK
jgi:hypothetical protein